MPSPLGRSDVRCARCHDSDATVSNWPDRGNRDALLACRSRIDRRGESPSDLNINARFHRPKGYRQGWHARTRGYRAGLAAAIHSLEAGSGLVYRALAHLRAPSTRDHLALRARNRSRVADAFTTRGSGTSQSNRLETDSSAAVRAIASPIKVATGRIR